jgi:hypothetical protein
MKPEGQYYKQWQGYVGEFIAQDLFFPVALRPNASHGLLILEVSSSHTTTHHSR